MNKLALAFTLALFCSLASCVSGRTEYTPPVTPPTIATSKVIERPRAEVWDAAVPQLGREFFVINTIDRASGLISLSFSGEPDAFCDCGVVKHHVVFNAQTADYEFKGAAANALFCSVTNGVAYRTERKVSLDGRVNLIFEEISPQSTRVTANVRFILTRTGTSIALGQQYAMPFSFSDTIAFGPNETVRLATSTTNCLSRGVIEKRLLDLIQ